MIESLRENLLLEWYVVLHFMGEIFILCLIE